jgi:DNA-binding NtrC family response regulator
VLVEVAGFGVQNMKVLIVQNEGALGSIWKRHLERLGAQVTLATCGFTAVELLEVVDFDVIVLDLVLAQGSALSIADVAHYRQPDSNVIFVTDTTFFSDGSIFALSGNARAFIQSETPPQDIAEIVFHYGSGVSLGHEVRGNPTLG